MKQPIPMPDILRTAEVSEMTTIPAETLRYWRWRNRGEGPRSYKLGRAVVYDRADVEAWMAERKNATVTNTRKGAA